MKTKITVYRTQIGDPGEKPVSAVIEHASDQFLLSATVKRSASGAPFLYSYWYTDVSAEDGWGGTVRVYG